MDDAPESNATKPTDLLALREKLEARWSDDYLNGPPPEAQGFSFLLGDWYMTRYAYDLNGDVTDKSEGEMHARYLLNGRVIQEEYHSYLPDGRVFRGGIGLYTYVPGTGQWVTASVDAAIGVSNATLHKDGNEFNYASSFEVQGATVQLRGRWFDISKDSFKWAGSGSVDGDSWFKTFEVHMVRQGAR